MYKVSSLKRIQNFSLIITSICFFAIFAVDECANKLKSSDIYFWSSSVREAASSAISLEVISIIVFIFMLANCILAFYLDRNGKVCPTCGLVYTQYTTTCLKCKTDITHAESVAEYKKRTGTAEIMPKIKIDNLQTFVQGRNLNRERKKFCTSCGQKIEETDKYCPKCGMKL